MNKIILTLLLILFFGSYSYTQVDFEFTSFHPQESRQINGAYEHSDGTYIIPVTTLQSFTEDGFITLVKLNEEGIIQMEAEISLDSFHIGFPSLFYIDNQIVILGSIRRKLNTQDIQYWVGTFDEDFTLLEEQFFEPFEEGMILLQNGVQLEGDSTIVIVGSSIMNQGPKDFGVRLHLNNNTYEINYLDGGTSWINDFVQHPNSDGYLLLGKELRHADNNFQSIVDVEFQQDVNTLFIGSILPNTDTTYIINQRIYNPPPIPHGVITGVFTDSLVALKEHRIIASSMDTFYYPATRQSMDRSNNGNIYTGGTYHIDNNSIFQSSNNSAFFLIKYDSALDKLWQKYYGLDSNYYFMTGLIATSDGGCLMYGHRFTEDQKWEAIAIKVSENGTMTNTTVLEKASIKIEVYPNPFIDELYFKSEFSGEATLDILDINGRKLLSIDVDDLSQFEINLSSLAVGIYFYKIKNKEKILQQGKLIKQN